MPTHLLGGSAQTMRTGHRQTLTSPLIFVPLLTPALSLLRVQQQHWGFGMVPLPREAGEAIPSHGNRDVVGSLPPR